MHRYTSKHAYDALLMCVRVCVQICRHLPALVTLDISHCKGTGLAPLSHATALRTLTAQHCDGIQDSQLQTALQACTYVT